MTSIDYNLNSMMFSLLMSFRIGAFFFSMPMFSEVKISMLVAVLLPIGMAFLIAPTLDYNVMDIMRQDAIRVFVTVATEIIVGLFMGFSINVLLVFATMIGELVGMEAGFSMASLFDPNLGQVPILGFLLRNIFLLAFFMFNFHHVFIMMMVKSYETLPVGTNLLEFTQAVPALVKLFASVYLMAFRIVLPVIFMITLSHITMGVISITAPQMNIYFNAAISLNMVIALFLFAISFPTVFGFFRVALDSMEQYFAAFFAVA